MLQKKWILAVWKLYGAAHLTSSLLLSRFLHTDSYLFISFKKKKKKKKTLHRFYPLPMLLDLVTYIPVSSP